MNKWRYLVAIALVRIGKTIGFSAGIENGSSSGKGSQTSSGNGLGSQLNAMPVNGCSGGNFRFMSTFLCLIKRQPTVKQAV